MNALLIGVIGVLEGLSIGIVKFLNDTNGGSPLRMSFADVWLDTPVGTEGSANAGSSSISSIDGKA